MLPLGIIKKYHCGVFKVPKGPSITLRELYAKRYIVFEMHLIQVKGNLDLKM